MSGAQVAADLRAAAEVLRRDGWTQGFAEDEAGRCCAIGAIEKVTGTDSGSREGQAYAALRSYLARPVVHFNDAPGRTADEVIAALEAAADAAEASDV